MLPTPCKILGSVITHDPHYKIFLVRPWLQQKTVHIFNHYFFTKPIQFLKEYIVNNGKKNWLPRWCQLPNTQINWPRIQHQVGSKVWKPNISDQSIDWVSIIIHRFFSWQSNILNTTSKSCIPFIYMYERKYILRMK